MRPNVDPQKIERLMQALGREAHGSGCIYFTGGASALLVRWRSSTVDVADVLRSKVETFIKRFEGKLEEGQR